jgi:hypothetical protein
MRASTMKLIGIQVPPIAGMSGEDAERSDDFG